MPFVNPRAEYYKRRGQLLEVMSGASYRFDGYQDAWFHEKGKTCHIGVSDEYLTHWTLVTRKAALEIAKRLRVDLRHEATSDATIQEAEGQQKLWWLTKQFVHDQRIHCGETIYQSDRVIENGYEFMHEACKIVGFHKSEKQT